MADSAYGQIAADGFWKNNVAFVQILGLCPLLAVTSTFINGLGLGLATTLVLVSSNVTVSLIRHLVRPEVRIPVFVLVIASFVTAVELTMNAWFHDLYKILGIFIPLIVTNCAILGRAEAFASKNAVGPALVDGLTMGFGFTMALILLGSMREIVGSGTLFAQAHLMFGEGARDLAITLISDYRGFLLAILPPGAFIGLGLLIALKNVIDNKITERSKTAAAAAEPAVEPSA
ncbi:electron transport complex subunit E [Thiohalomonas denitrificans]|uniref:Ion-translocating oxidoreductase complex subunit E n=1 Tax=Thiohalomonas denitrificans TaxID=415747 RepID=A0A1G5QM30_9GAMM|nr:electron transport complex subunit E [Thiohalomonas denitrificans]SCZ62797.1 electron transport complex protein RnfE [Thiohalomonas denitrificans]